MSIAPGFTYFSQHLWIVIAVVPGSPEKAIVTSLTTKREGSDTTVVLRVGDHPFVKHDSVVSYIDTRAFEVAALSERISDKSFAERTPLSDDLLKVIQQGLLDSPFTEKIYKKVCAALIKDGE